MASVLLDTVGRGANAPWRTRNPLPAHPRFANFAALEHAHKQSCDACRNDRPCDTRDGIEYALLRGVHPTDFPSAATTPGADGNPTTTPHFATYVPCSPQEVDHLKRTHARWQKEGVVEFARQAAVHPTAPAFVVTKRKVKPGKQAEALQWALDNPSAVEKCLIDNTLWPDHAYSTKLRGVYSLKAVNSRMAKPPMRYPTVHTARHRATTALSLAALDFTEGYTSVRVASDAAPHFRCTTPGELDILHRTVPFGWRGAPFLFCFISAALAAALRETVLPPGTTTTVYVDDILVVFPLEPSAARRPLDNAITFLREMGMRINDTKTQGPSRSVEFLGWKLQCSQHELSVAVPAAKLHTCSLWLRSALSKVALSLRAWETLTGVLEFASAFTPGASPAMADLYACKARALHSGGEYVPMSSTARTAANWLLRNLPTSLTPLAPWVRLPIQRTLWALTDASGEGGLGGVVAAPGEAAQVFSTYTPESVRWHGNGNSTILELLAVKQAVRLATMTAGTGNKQVTDMHVGTDSQAAAALLRKGRCTTLPAANQIIREIAEICVDSGTHLHMHWLPREANTIADALSHPDNPPPHPLTLAYSDVKHIILTSSDSAQKAPTFAAERRKTPRPAASSSCSRPHDALPSPGSDASLR